MARSWLRKLISLTSRQQCFLARASWHLGRARIDFGRHSANQIVETLRKARTPAQAPVSAADVALISWAIRTAASAVPWRSDCLIQSMAADHWLRRLGVVPDFRLGVKAAPGGTLLAHAWIEVDGMVLTGGDATELYEVLIAG